VLWLQVIRRPYTSRSEASRCFPLIRDLATLGQQEVGLGWRVHLPSKLERWYEQEGSKFVTFWMFRIVGAINSASGKLCLDMMYLVGVCAFFNLTVGS